MDFSQNNLTFINFDGLSNEDQAKLQSMLFGQTSNNKDTTELPSGDEYSGKPSVARSLTASPNQPRKHVFNVHAEEFVPQNFQRSSTPPASSGANSNYKAPPNSHYPRHTDSRNHYHNKITVLQNPNSRSFNRGHAGGDARKGPRFYNKPYHHDRQRLSQERDTVDFRWNNYKSASDDSPPANIDGADSRSNVHNGDINSNVVNDTKTFHHLSAEPLVSDVIFNSEFNNGPSVNETLEAQIGQEIMFESSSQGGAKFTCGANDIPLEKLPSVNDVPCELVPEVVPRKDSLDGVEVRKRDFMSDDEWSQGSAEMEVDGDWSKFEPQTPWSSTGFSARTSGAETLCSNSVSVNSSQTRTLSPVHLFPTHHTPVDFTHQTPMDSTHQTPMDSTHHTPMDSTHHTPVDYTHHTPLDSTRHISVDSIHHTPVDFVDVKPNPRIENLLNNLSPHSEASVTSGENLNNSAPIRAPAQSGLELSSQTTRSHSGTNSVGVLTTTKLSSTPPVSDAPNSVTEPSQTKPEQSRETGSVDRTVPSKLLGSVPAPKSVLPSCAPAAASPVSVRAAVSETSDSAATTKAAVSNASSAGKSWAALVSSNLPPTAHNVFIKEPSPQLFASSTSVQNGFGFVIECEENEAGDTSDKLAKRLREYLKTAQLSHRPPSLYPRGLINRANWCYVNATLQALLACPPFFNLFKNLPKCSATERGTSSTPVIDSICEFINEFNFMKPSAYNRNKKLDRQPTIGTDKSFEPDYIYKMLTKLKSTDAFKQGRQEDAEEFLTCVLNHMHDELLSITNPEHISHDNKDSGSESSKLTNGHGDDVIEDDDADPAAWEQVGRKKKATITRAPEMVRSLVSDMFCGQIRSVLRQSGNRESATLEPFFSLPLDIQHDKIRSVKDALDGLVSREAIQGYTCSRTKEEVEATKCTMLEVLPPVLVLHMKCFIYDKNGGCQKLCKDLEYNVDLEISKDIISPTTRSKIRDNQRGYKLFAVVYHHGKTLQGGHYTTDVYHNGINGWIRIDDHNISVVTVHQVLKFAPARMPYLLYYRRHDFIGDAASVAAAKAISSI